LLKHAQKKKLNKYLTSKLQFSQNFTLDSVADSNYRGKCDIGGFLNFEWTVHADSRSPFITNFLISKNHINMKIGS
jgi:hypothetical protein